MTECENDVDEDVIIAPPKQQLFHTLIATFRIQYLTPWWMAVS